MSTNPPNSTSDLPATFRALLPCGLEVLAVQMPFSIQSEHAGEWLWSLEHDGTVIARGYSPDRQTALVCLRWAATSCLQRSLEQLGKVMAL